MKYILDADLAYLETKYHPADAPASTVPYNRFVCHDQHFDLSTGLAAAEMEAGLRAYLETLEDTDHAVIKAKAFRYVTEHTPIQVSGHDYFVAIHSTNRVIGKVLVNRWSGELFGKMLPEVNGALHPLSRDCALTHWPDYDHSVPDWDYMLPLGFAGLLTETRKAKAAFQGEMPPEAAAFYDSIVIELEAALALVDRFIAYAEAHPNEKTDVVLPALRSLRIGAPKTTYEVLLFIYIYFMLSEHIEGLQVRSLSNLDRMLLPYWEKDLADGVPVENLRMYTAYFFLQFSAIGNYWGQPVYFGGTLADETSAVNGVTYELLDIYDQMGIFNPKLQLKYSAVSPEKYLTKALDMIRRGHSSIVFVSEEYMRAGLEQYGISPDEARMCNVSGCYEFAPRQCIGATGSYINLAKFVEYALFGGVDPKTGNSIGLNLPTEFATYEEFEETYLRYAFDTVERCIAAVRQYQPYYSYVNPMPLYSSTVPHSLQVGKDAYCQGAITYFTKYMLGATANMADSLAMVKKYVFDKKELTMDELRAALRADFVGYEVLHAKLKNDPDKYGNNADLPDTIAKRVTAAIARHINGTPDGRGGINIAGSHVARMYLNWRDATGSLPDGRVRGEELAKNASPSQGNVQNGVTASVLSMTKLEGLRFTGDFSLDISVHPTAVAGEPGMTALLTLLDTFRMRGGHAVHFNVVDTAELLEAQAHPEKYGDLQIRVCGWNSLFVTMPKHEQDAFIRGSGNGN